MVGAIGFLDAACFFGVVADSMGWFRRQQNGQSQSIILSVFAPQFRHLISDPLSDQHCDKLPSVVLWTTIAETSDGSGYQVGDCASGARLVRTDYTVGTTH